MKFAKFFRIAFLYDISYAEIKHLMFVILSLWKTCNFNFTLVNKKFFAIESYAIRKCFIT